MSEICVQSLRQYPLYNKTAPPPALATTFTPEVFDKSQKYGKDKARFALFSSTFNQILEIAVIYFDLQVWAWSAAAALLNKYGYTGYEARCLHTVNVPV
jgi:STE24 endopeptidase